VVTPPVQSTTALAETAASATATTPTSAAETTTQAAAVTTSTSAAAETEASEAAVAVAEPEVDLSSLDPAARLAAWTEVETIQVLPGETLWLIAQNYDTTVSAIATLNNISDPSTLSIGQQLMIPVGFAEEIVATPAVASEVSETAVAEEGSAAVTAAVDAEAPPLSGDLANWHSIAPVLIEEGDGLAAIADANDTTIEAIMALNGITDPNLILVGDMLLVPVGYQGDAGVVAAAPEETTLTTGDEAAAVASSEDLMEEEGTTGAAGEEDDMMEE
jgi:lysozyme